MKKNRYIINTENLGLFVGFDDTTFQPIFVKDRRYISKKIYSFEYREDAEKSLKFMSEHIVLGAIDIISVHSEYPPYVLCKDLIDSGFYNLSAQLLLNLTPSSNKVH